LASSLKKNNLEEIIFKFPFSAGSLRLNRL
jgi:hypothetical protein